MKPSRTLDHSSLLADRVTRRDFVARTAAGGAALASGVPWLVPAAATAAGPPPTTVLINEPFLRGEYPNDIEVLLAAIHRFVERQNGEVLNTDGTRTPRDIKSQLLRHPRHPKRLVIFGDDEAIPRFKINWRNDRVYFFKGDQYLRYDIPNEKIGPLTTTANTWALPKAWLTGVSAALGWSNNRVYFFKGDQYLGYDIAHNQANNPKPIAGNWRGFPKEWASGIDCAINWGNGKAYFFKGSQYIRYDIAAETTDSNYPRPIAGNWPGFPQSWQSGINGAVTWSKGKVYFFKGSEYLRYDIAAGCVEDGYPRPIAGNWKGFPAAWSTGFDLVVRAPGVDLSVDYFYGDLDGDGLAEVATSRVLGSPPAMLRQLEASAAASAPQALFLNNDARGGEGGLEANEFGRIFAQLGCAIAEQDWAEPQTLAGADVVFYAGHGDPSGWYSGAIGTMVTAKTVPDLARQPIVLACACSTVTPGSPLLRAFMDNGCRTYVGAASDSYGWTSGYLFNELMLHFADALRENPSSTLAEAVGEARARFVRVNELASTLLQLEYGDYPVKVDDVLVHTALQVQVIGDVTATFPKSLARPNVSLQPLDERSRTMRAGNTIPITYENKPADGLTNVLLRAEWDSDVSAGLRIEVWQNRELLHKLDWKEQREWWAYRDFSMGGYWEHGRYHAIALLPLVRRLGKNEAAVRLLATSKPITLRAESELQIWPKRKLEHPVQPQLPRKNGINILWLCHDLNVDLQPMRRALAAIEGSQFDHHTSFGEMKVPYEFPDEVDYQLDLTQYDVIFVDHLRNGYRQFPRGMASRVREFVRGGGGLIVAGGPTSFAGKYCYAGWGGEGGYGGTPVEEALPVKIVGDADMVVGRSRVGAVDARHPVMSGLDWSSCPSIFGYNRVVAKPGAVVLARTEARDPLLTVWQFGKGRAAAFTTSSAREWGAELKNWRQYNVFWANLIRWASSSRTGIN